MPDHVRLADLPSWLAARTPANPLIYAAGCVGEPSGVDTALAASGDWASAARWTGIWIPGVNQADWSATAPGSAAETIFLAPNLRPGFEAGRVRFRPHTYTQAWAHLSTLAVDAALFSISPPDSARRCSLGVSADFTSAVFDQAKLRIGVVREDMPVPPSAPAYPAEAFDALVAADAPLLEAPDPDLDPVFLRIGEHIAGLVRDGDTVQLGLGKVQVGVLRALSGHRRLGLHAGMTSDSLTPLLDADVLDRVTTGVALGGRSLYEQVACDPRVTFRPVGHTHDIRTLAAIDGLTAVNSVIEVDLFGQANAEFLRGRQISGGGGLVDFLRGARLAPGGRPVVALASTAKSGRISRITPRLQEGAVTVSRADIGYVATEHGVADLRALDVDARAAALIDIADPAHHDHLQEAWDRMRRAM